MCLLCQGAGTCADSRSSVLRGGTDLAQSKSLKCIWRPRTGAFLPSQTRLLASQELLPSALEKQLQSLRFQLWP